MRPCMPSAHNPEIATTDLKTKPQFPYDGSALDFYALGEMANENIGASIALVDRDGQFLYVTPRYADAFNATQQQLSGKSLHDLYEVDQIAEFFPYIQRALAGENVTYERLRRGGKSDRWNTVSVTPWRDQTGRIAGALTVSLRVHELKVHSEALRSANERLHSHLENSPLGVIELDADMRISSCSALLTHMLGIQFDPATNSSLFDLLRQPLDAKDSDYSVEPLRNSLERLRGGHESRNRVEICTQHSVSGEPVYTEWFSSALTDQQGRMRSMMLLVHDITTQKMSVRRLEYAATHDALTGLGNRRHAVDSVERALKRAGQTGEKVAVIFVDLNDFKSVNDTFGHDVGDQVLQETARRLRENTRQSDFVARLGGDEFLILLDKDVTDISLNALCERMRIGLTDIAPNLGRATPFSAAIGIAQTTGGADALDADALIRNADLAMYASKRETKRDVT